MLSSLCSTKIGAAPNNVTVVFDPNCRPAITPDLVAYKRRLRIWLNLANLVKVSDQDLEWLESGRALDSIAKEWLTHGPKAVIITQGEKGSTLYRDGCAPMHVPAARVAVIDTVGAGDTYTAGLMVGLLENGHQNPAQLGTHSNEVWREVMRFAAAAINCTRAGANSPTRPEVLGFVLAEFE